MTIDDKCVGCGDYFEDDTDECFDCGSCVLCCDCEDDLYDDPIHEDEEEW